MAPLLTSDAWIEILSRLTTLADLHSAILAIREIQLAFNERRSALLATVLRTEIAAIADVDVYAHTDAVAARLKTKTADAITVYEAIEPLLENTVTDVRFYKWSLNLCRLYNKHGTEAKRQAILQRAYKNMLTGFTPNFDLPQNEPLTTPGPSFNRLPKVCYALADRLAACTERLDERLLLEKEIFRRTAIKDIDSLDWGNRVVKTLRSRKDQLAAVQFETYMYDLCRYSRMLDRSLFWARHLVSEYTEPHDIAIAEQRRVLTHLHGGSNEYIAWARQLIVMLRRRGYDNDALLLKENVWTTMTIDCPAYFGWTRELANLYRQHYRKDDALRVIREMHAQTQRALANRPRDQLTKYHASQAALALVGEYEYAGRLDDAAGVRQSFVAVA